MSPIPQIAQSWFIWDTGCLPRLAAFSAVGGLRWWQLLFMFLMQYNTISYIILQCTYHNIAIHIFIYILQFIQLAALYKYNIIQFSFKDILRIFIFILFCFLCCCFCCCGFAAPRRRVVHQGGEPGRDQRRQWADAGHRAQVVQPVRQLHQPGGRLVYLPLSPGPAHRRLPAPPPPPSGKWTGGVRTV